MRVRHYAQGKFYEIDCPQCTRLVRRSDDPGAEPCDLLVVPLNGKEVRIPTDPPELLPMLAESGNFGISLVGAPLPVTLLAGVTCPNCSEDDVNWLHLRDDTATVDCDLCGEEFVVPIPVARKDASLRRAGG